MFLVVDTVRMQVGVIIREVRTGVSDGGGPHRDVAGGVH